MEFKMTRTNLKFILEAKGLSMSSIANDVGVSAPFVYDVLNGKRTSARISAKFEEVFETPFEEIRVAWKNTNPPALTPDVMRTIKALGIAIPA
jgi:transcriptional regulator with XRE-family HTH domain